MKKLLFWQNSKWDKSQQVTCLSSKIVINLQNPNCDKNCGKKKYIYVTKLQNSNCEETQKLNCWQNSRTQIVTKLDK